MNRFPPLSWRCSVKECSYLFILDTHHAENPRKNLFRNKRDLISTSLVGGKKQQINFAISFS